MWDHPSPVKIINARSIGALDFQSQTLHRRRDSEKKIEKNLNIKSFLCATQIIRDTFLQFSDNGLKAHVTLNCEMNCRKEVSCKA